jgi:uncharacterized protein YbbC (DUF1343 family)
MYINKNTIWLLQFKNVIICILILFIITSCNFSNKKNEVKTNLPELNKLVTVGADRLFTEFSHLIKDKKLALVSNHTGKLSNGTHLADTLFNYPNAQLIALFGMYYNIRTNDYSIPKDKEADIDAETGLPKYSLYGSHHKPTPAMLKDVQVIIFDIQEVGARFYEHINILGLVMEAAVENNIELIVLDRPNPITGLKMDGFITDDEFLYSFGAFGKVPVIHGMTTGEIAKLYNPSGALRAGLRLMIRERTRRAHTARRAAWGGVRAAHASVALAGSRCSRKLTEWARRTVLRANAGIEPGSAGCARALAS